MKGILTYCFSRVRGPRNGDLPAEDLVDDNDDDDVDIATDLLLYNIADSIYLMLVYKRKRRVYIYLSREETLLIESTLLPLVQRAQT